MPHHEMLDEEAVDDDNDYDNDDGDGNSSNQIQNHINDTKHKTNLVRMDCDGGHLVCALHRLDLH